MDAVDGTDETAVPEHPDGPGEEEGEEDEEADKAYDCGQDETDFHDGGYVIETPHYNTSIKSQEVFSFTQILHHVLTFYVLTLYL